MSGIQFDKNGDLNGSWLTTSDLDRYKEASNCFIEQYVEYSQMKYPGSSEETRKNDYEMAKFRLSENVTDSGGLRAAYMAHRMATGLTAPNILLEPLNLTVDKLFFVANAQVRFYFKNNCTCSNLTLGFD